MIKYLVIVFVLVGQLIFGQQLSEREEVNSKLFILNDYQISLSKSSIAIIGNGGAVFNRDIEGVKSLKYSPEKEYFFIANFNFPSDKSDYPITVLVFDKNSQLRYTHELNAYYDMPHPIFSINDNGILGAFDLLSVKLDIVNGETLKSYSLEKEAEFEMERSAFLDMTDNSAYILATLKPAAIELGEKFTSLYKVNIETGIQQKIEPDITSITMLRNIDGKILISGIKFVKLTPTPAAVILDENLNEDHKLSHAMEKLIKIGDKYYSKFSNTISVFNSKFILLDEYKFDDIERVKDLHEFNGDLVVATERQEENFLYHFDERFNIEIKVRLDIFGFNKIEGLDSYDDKLIIRMSDNSIILN